MRSILFDIPNLNEDLAPGFRIGAAIERLELSGLDFGDVIARLHRTAIIIKDQRRILGTGENGHELAEGDVFLLHFAVVDRVHLRYSIFQRFKDC